LLLKAFAFRSTIIQCIYLSIALTIPAPFSNTFASEKTLNAPIQLNTLSKKEQSFLDTQKNIRLCINMSRMPQEGIDNQGEYMGLSADIKQLIAKKIGKPIITIHVNQQNQLIPYLIDDKCDAFSTTERPINNNLLSSSQAYFQDSISIAIATNKTPIYKLDYLLDKHFAINKHAVFFNRLLDKYPEIQFTPVHNAKTGLALVATERVYAYIDSLTTLAYQAKKNGMLGIKTVSFLDNKIHHYYVIQKEKDLLLSILNKAIVSITKTEKNTIISTWAGISHQPNIASPPFYLWGFILLSLILFICLILVFKIKYQKVSLQQLLTKSLLENKQLNNNLFEKEKSEKQSIRFAEMFSHEYRTPVSIISTNLDILELKNNQSPLYIESQLTKMRDAVSKLIILVETALDRESLAATNLIAEKADINFMQLIDDVANEMSINYPERKLLIYMPEKHSILFGDIKLLKIMITNLIENSFKYSHIKQPVTVNIRADSNRIFITVIDKGIGIPSADIKHIFDKYHRASNTSNASGIGLGLYLSRLIVNQHKGDISVICPPEGGTRIKIELPL